MENTFQGPELPVDEKRRHVVSLRIKPSQLAKIQRFCKTKRMRPCNFYRYLIDRFFYELDKSEKENAQ